MGYSVLKIDDVEGAGRGGMVKFLRRELDVQAFGVNWFEIGPNMEGVEHDEVDTGQEEVNVIVRGSGIYRIDGEEVPFTAPDDLSLRPGDDAAAGRRSRRVRHGRGRFPPGQLRGARAVLIRIVLWNLADSLSSIGELRRYLQDEAVDAFERVPGLLFKAWFSDEVTERWGAVYVFESREASEQELPSRVRALIGKEPDVVEVFDLEASVSVATELARLGLAFE